MTREEMIETITARIIEMTDEEAAALLNAIDKEDE